MTAASEAHQAGCPMVVMYATGFPARGRGAGSHCGKPVASRRGGPTDLGRCWMRSGLFRRQVSSAGSAYSPGRLTTIASWVLRAMTTTASSERSGFSSRWGTNGGTKM